jgi:hypothetical protein
MAIDADDQGFGLAMLKPEGHMACGVCGESTPAIIHKLTCTAQHSRESLPQPETWGALHQLWKPENIHIVIDMLETIKDGNGLVYVRNWRPADVNRVLEAAFSIGENSNDG